PRLGDDARRLREYAVKTERLIEAHDVLGIEPPEFRSEPVEGVDAVLRVQAIAAHIPFTRRAVLARHGVGVPHDPNDEIARRESRTLGCLLDAPQRFVADDQPLVAGWSGAVLGSDDLAIGAAYAETDGAHEHGAAVRSRDAKGFELQRVGDAGLHRECTHGLHGFAQ